MLPAKDLVDDASGDSTADLTAMFDDANNLPADDPLRNPAAAAAPDGCSATRSAAAAPKPAAKEKSQRDRVCCRRRCCRRSRRAAEPARRCRMPQRARRRGCTPANAAPAAQPTGRQRCRRRCEQACRCAFVSGRGPARCHRASGRDRACGAAGGQRPGARAGAGCGNDGAQRNRDRGSVYTLKSRPYTIRMLDGLESIYAVDRRAEQRLTVMERADAPAEITGVEYDSRRVKPGDVFVAMRGGSDGWQSLYRCGDCAGRGSGGDGFARGLRRAAARTSIDWRGAGGAWPACAGGGERGGVGASRAAAGAERGDRDERQDDDGVSAGGDAAQRADGSAC